jgi:hypothetical protein
MALIAALAVLVPWALLRKDTRSQREVALTIWASAGVMLIASGLVYALLYAARGHEVWAAFTQAPLATAWFFMGIAGYAALLWVPILGLVWFSMAQGVERLKGHDLALRGQDRDGTSAGAADLHPKDGGRP